MLKRLDLDALCREAAAFAEATSAYPDPALFLKADGKSIGTFIERKFKAHLTARYGLATSSAAKGIDLPDLPVDIKVTSIRSPQSSCPFKSTRQKIFGLGYGLLVFVYEKMDDVRIQATTLNIVHVVLIHKHRTGDSNVTRQIRAHLEIGANVEDLIGLMRDLWLPLKNSREATEIAQDLLSRKPEQGHLGITFAPQWRLRYREAISVAGQVDGVVRIR